MDINQKTRQVMQRVQGDAPRPEIRQLPELIAEEKADAAAYLHLSHRFGGKEGAMLRRMFEEEQTHISCLRGIFRLMTGERCQIHTTPQPLSEDAAVLLRRCYGREMRCLSVYEAHAADPEYGPVFLQLAREEKEHCKNILHLIGKLDPK